MINFDDIFKKKIEKNLIQIGCKSLITHSEY